MGCAGTSQIQRMSADTHQVLVSVFHLFNAISWLWSPQFVTQLPLEDNKGYPIQSSPAWPSLIQSSAAGWIICTNTAAPLIVPLWPLTSFCCGTLCSWLSLRSALTFLLWRLVSLRTNSHSQAWMTQTLHPHRTFHRLLLLSLQLPLLRAAALVKVPDVEFCSVFIGF